MLFALFASRYSPQIDEGMPWNVIAFVGTINGQALEFPNLTTDSTSEDLKSNLIMPESTVFLSPSFPPVLIMRPTTTQGAASDETHCATGVTNISEDQIRQEAER